MRAKLELVEDEILNCTTCEAGISDQIVFLEVKNGAVTDIQCAECRTRETAELRRDDGEDR